MNKITILKNVLCIATLMFTMSLSAQSESEAITASDNPVIKSAPHLPVMERSTEEGNLFYGAQFTYNKVDNEKALKEWSENYPNEVASYKIAIDSYLKNTDVSKLSAADQNTFYDLKSQWLMATQLIN